MFSIDDPSEKETEEIIEKVANRILQQGMEATAIVLLESSKPVSHIRTQLGQKDLTPILPLLKRDLGLFADKILREFEKRNNIEKPIDLIEEKRR